MAEIENQTYTLHASGVLASGANNGSEQHNKGNRGVTIVVVTTAGSGTSPTLVVKLQERVGASTWVDISGATTATISNMASTSSFTLYPGVTVAGNAGISRPLGEHWRYVATVGGSDTPTVTCSIHAQLHV